METINKTYPYAVVVQLSPWLSRSLNKNRMSVIISYQKTTVLNPIEL